MNMSIEGTPAPGSKYLSTVMSLVCRWPPFDFVTHSKYFYQRIKSENIMKASLISKASGAQAKTAGTASSANDGLVHQRVYKKILRKLVGHKSRINTNSGE
jgi:hypothetical protein